MSYFEDFVGQKNQEEQVENIEKEDNQKEDKAVKETSKAPKPRDPINREIEKELLEVPDKLVGDKHMDKNQILNYICKKLFKKREKYTLDYLRALKYNLDAIDIAK
jgi:hypothetical protein